MTLFAYYMTGRSGTWGGGGVASVHSCETRCVKGIVVDIDEEHVTTLDRYEGHPTGMLSDRQCPLLLVSWTAITSYWSLFTLYSLIVSLQTLVYLRTVRTVKLHLGEGVMEEKEVLIYVSETTVHHSIYFIGVSDPSLPLLLSLFPLAHLWYIYIGEE